MDVSESILLLMSEVDTWFMRCIDVVDCKLLQKSIKQEAKIKFKSKMAFLRCVGTSICYLRSLRLHSNAPRSSWLCLAPRRLPYTVSDTRTQQAPKAFSGRSNKIFLHSLLQRAIEVSKHFEFEVEVAVCKRTRTRSFGTQPSNKAFALYVSEESTCQSQIRLVYSLLFIFFISGSSPCRRNNYILSEPNNFMLVFSLTQL